MGIALWKMVEVSVQFTGHVVWSWVGEVISADILADIDILTPVFFVTDKCLVRCNEAVFVVYEFVIYSQLWMWCTICHNMYVTCVCHGGG